MLSSANKNKTTLPPQMFLLICTPSNNPCLICTTQIILIKKVGDNTYIFSLTPSCITPTPSDEAADSQDAVEQAHRAKAKIMIERGWGY